MRLISIINIFILLFALAISDAIGGNAHTGYEVTKEQQGLSIPPPTQPTQAEIDAAISEATANGRIVNITSGGLSIPAAMKEIGSLPAIFRTVIQGHSYDITVLSMQFTAIGASVNIGCRFELPGSKTTLYFGSNDIPASGKNGFKGELAILTSSLSDAKSSEIDDPEGLLKGQTLFAEFSLPGFKDQLVMGLGAASKMSLSCGAFEQFTLDGFIKAHKLVERETSNGLPSIDSKPLLLIFSNQQSGDWKDILMNARVSSAFHAGNYPDMGFHFTDQQSVLIDLSQLRNPSGLPQCAQSQAEAWQGVAFPAFKVRLPRFFLLKSGATLSMGSGKNLFLDASGLIGDVTAEKVYTLTDGYTDPVNKYGMSLDKLTTTFSCNGLVTASMLGKIEIPWCGTDTKKSTPLLRYSLRFTDNRYEVFIKDSEKGNFSSNIYTLASGSQVSFHVDNSIFAIGTVAIEKPMLSNDVYANSVCKDFPVTLSASQCTGKQLIWSTGQTGRTITVKPETTTTYSVKCQDDFCVSAVSDSMKITVHESLPQPTLRAGLDAICRDGNTTVTTSECVGKIEWKTPGSNSFLQVSANTLVQNVHFPNVNQISTFTYYTRCNLNGCLSPEATKAIVVQPEPQAPNLASNALNNTIDRNGQVTLSGSCASGQRLIWKDLQQTSLSLANTSTYSATCRNDATGCESLNAASITIHVLYSPPPAPTHLLFSGAGPNNLTINWQDNAHQQQNEDGFQVIRSSNASHSDARIIGQVAQNITSYGDTGLSEGVTYYYQVIAYNKYDRSYSDWAARNTVVKPKAPVLTADNQSITRGSEANVSGHCNGLGDLVWLEPASFEGGT